MSLMNQPPANEDCIVLVTSTNDVDFAVGPVPPSRKDLVAKTFQAFGWKTRFVRYSDENTAIATVRTALVILAAQEEEARVAAGTPAPTLN